MKDRSPTSSITGRFMRCLRQIISVCMLVCRSDRATTNWSCISCADVSGGCVFGKRIYRLSQTKLMNNQGAPLSCSLCGALCYGANFVLSLHVFSV